MKKSRCAAVLGIMLALGGSAVLWAQTTATTVPPVPPPAATQAATEPVSAADVAAAKEHLSKAVDLFYTQRKVPQASDEVDKALALDPNLRDAQTLRAVIDQSISAGPNGGGPALNRELLTKNEINRIKVVELSDEDIKNATGSIPRKVLDDFWKNVVLNNGLSQAPPSQQAYNNFIDPSNFRQQVRMIKNAQGTAYYGDITIVGDPSDIADFKRTIQPFVVKNCATSGCHGGRDNHGFPFISGAKDANAAAYTNFYIMSTLANGGNMIDRLTPKNSLFIQYAVNPQNAQIAHPGKPIPYRFGSIDDPGAQALVIWVKSLRFPSPNYGIDFTIPAPLPKPATSAPATP